MKKIFIVLFAVVALTSCDSKKQVTETVVEAVSNEYILNNSTDSLSYAIGLSISENFKQQGIELNPQAMADAIERHVDSTNTWDFMMANQYVQTELQRMEEEKTIGLQAEGKNFLTENAKNNPNVKTTESGLQYLILQEGTGGYAQATDKVTVHYTGTLIDGTVFDSSVARGTPATFGLNQVIKGWTEGLQLVKEGGKIRLFIPQDLAYGPQGRPGSIAPYSTLLFDVELISIATEE